jgi:hypothetical protein
MWCGRVKPCPIQRLFQLRRLFATLRFFKDPHASQSEAAFAKGTARVRDAEGEREMAGGETESGVHASAQQLQVRGWRKDTRVASLATAAKRMRWSGSQHACLASNHATPHPGQRTNPPFIFSL